MLRLKPRPKKAQGRGAGGRRTRALTRARERESAAIGWRHIPGAAQAQHRHNTARPPVSQPASPGAPQPGATLVCMYL